MIFQSIGTAIVGVLLCVGACGVDGSSDGSSERDDAVVSEVKTGPTPGVEWYYTCSDDLLACRAGYGAVESIPSVDCLPYAWRLRCVKGAENP